MKTATTTAPIDSAAVSPLARNVPPLDQKLADTAPVTLHYVLAITYLTTRYSSTHQYATKALVVNVLFLGSTGRMS